MNSVRAASASSSALARSVPSTLETKRTRGAFAVSGCSASTAMAGPRSEPPMPMLMTVVNGAPPEPRTTPSRTLFGELQHALALGEHLARDVFAARGVGGDAGHAQRGVQHRATFGGVDGLAAPHGLDARAQVRRHRRGWPAGAGRRRRCAGARNRGTGRRPRARIGCRAPDPRRAGRARRTARVSRGARLQGTPGGGQIVMGHRGRRTIRGCETGPRWYRQRTASCDSCQLRIDRQRQDSCVARSDSGKVLRLVAEIGETLLHVQRQRVVDLGSHARASPSQRAQLVAALRRGCSTGYRCAARRRGAGGGVRTLPSEPGAREGRIVERRVALARRAPGIEVRQLHVEHRGLDFVEPEIAADELVVVLRLHAVHAQLHELRGERRIVGDAHARHRRTRRGSWWGRTTGSRCRRWSRRAGPARLRSRWPARHLR